MTFPQLAFIVDASGGSEEGVPPRIQAEILRGQLEAERATFLAHWRELNDYILPRRMRWVVQDVNRGERRTKNIVDSTGTMAARTLASGLMSGVTSPARPWFRLTTPDAELAEQSDVKAWLYEVQQRMLTVLLRSNFYNQLPIVYGDLGTFGTAAMAAMEDEHSVVRFYAFPIGSYAIANDERMQIRVFTRYFRMTALQVVQRWGMDPKTGKVDWSKISPTTRNLFERGTKTQWVDIVHVIQPNWAWDGGKFDARFKKYRSIYYELAAPVNLLLEDRGFDEFPVLVPRWECNAEDAYGTNCPGMTALGDIKQLQLGEKRAMQAVEKQINPPLVGPTALRSAKVSVLPGDVSYADLREGQQGLKPIYEVKFDIGQLEEKQQQVRARIERAFFADLFLMLTEMDRREITATEIAERKEEKLLALGPVLEQLNQDLLDPVIDRVFNIMARRGMIPPAPQALHGQPLRVEYISIMAQAQKAVGIQAVERFLSFLAQALQIDPQAMDAVDIDEVIDTYAEMVGVPPKLIRGSDQVQALRAQRAKAQQAAQQAAMAQSASQTAGNLAKADMSGDNMLTRLMGRRTASATMNATQGAPAMGNPVGMTPPAVPGMPNAA